jgi:hypothetical protein
MSKSIRVPVRKKLPAHLRNRLDRWYVLVRWANFLYGYYGIPVYLCGSALRDDNDDPRDWDIRIRMSAEQFERRFGSVDKYLEEMNTGMWTRVAHRWSAECVKRSKEGWGHTHLNIDFQIDPPARWRRMLKEPRIRLDTRDLCRNRPATTRRARRNSGGSIA